MKIDPKQHRSIMLIFLIIFFGAIIGTGFSVIFEKVLINYIIDENSEVVSIDGQHVKYDVDNVVFDFFTEVYKLEIKPTTIDFFVFDITFGFTLRIGVLSILGMAVAWYFIRYFK